MSTPESPEAATPAPQEPLESGNNLPEQDEPENQIPDPAGPDDSDPNADEDGEGSELDDASQDPADERPNDDELGSCDGAASPGEPNPSPAAAVQAGHSRASRAGGGHPIGR